MARTFTLLEAMLITFRSMGFVDFHVPFGLSSDELTRNV